MFLFASKYLQQQVAGDKVSNTLAMCDAFAEVDDCLLLQSQISPQDLFDVLTDPDRVEPLHVWQSAEEQDPVDQFVRILHLANGLVVFVLAELRHTPVLQGARMEKVLVDGGQFIGKLSVEVLDHFRVAEHGFLHLSDSPRRHQASKNGNQSAPC